jgi:hypothetical protein
VTLIRQYIPDSDETAKGHLKGQQQGIRSTKNKAFKKLLEDEETRIKIEGESSPFQPLPPTKCNDMFVRVVDLTEEIHTNQNGAFPHTSQRGNHGGHPFGCKLHFCGAYEEQDGRGNDQCIPKNNQSNESSRIGNQETGT